MMLSSKVQ